MKSFILLSADTGGGHTAVAQAIRAGLIARSVAAEKILIVDTFRQSQVWPFYKFAQFHRWAGISPVGRFWYQAMFVWDAGGPARLLADEVCYLAFLRFLEGLKRLYPDSVWVSLHPFLTQALGRWRQRRHPELPAAAFVTEFVLAPWACYHAGVSRCYVPTETLARQALRAGLPHDRVCVTGMPLKPGFSQGPMDTGECRRQLGLLEDLPLVLMIGGGAGHGGPIEQFCLALGRRCNPKAMQLVVIAGRNADLQIRLERLNLPFRTTVVGFVDDMHRWIGAADLVLTKAGPTTLCEVLAVGRAMLIFGHLPGTERHNVDFLVQGGAAVFATQPQAVAALTADLLDDAARRQNMIARAAGFARSGATESVVEGLLELSS